MKKLFYSVLFLLVTTVSNAQTEANVTKFLGIPVDGTKTEILSKLHQKGFRTSYKLEDSLEGNFNGTEVFVSPVMNGNKVWRIAVWDKNSYDEGQIKIRFNNLCQQFKNNPKYFSLTTDQTLSEKEDISYEISVHSKQYEASFLQDADINKVVWFTISESYGQYRLIIFYDNRRNQANGEDL